MLLLPQLITVGLRTKKNGEADARPLPLASLRADDSKPGHLGHAGRRHIDGGGLLATRPAAEETEGAEAAENETETDVLGDGTLIPLWLTDENLGALESPVERVLDGVHLLDEIAELVTRHEAVGRRHAGDGGTGAGGGVVHRLLL